jgi:hypothetical protein
MKACTPQTVGSLHTKKIGLCVYASDELACTPQEERFCTKNTAPFKGAVFLVGKKNHFQRCPSVSSSSRRRIFDFVAGQQPGSRAQHCPAGCWPAVASPYLPAKSLCKPSWTVHPLTMTDLDQLLSQVLVEWDCHKEGTLSPAISPTGLAFGPGSTYVDKVHVISLLTGGHTMHRGVLDEMAKINAMAKNGLIHVPNGVARRHQQCTERSGESLLHKAYDSLHPAARYYLEHNHTDYLTARTGADRLQGKLISLWVNSKVSETTLAVGMSAFPSVFAGGKIDAEYLPIAVKIIEGSISVGYGMVALCQIGTEMARALMVAETSSRVVDGEAPLAFLLQCIGDVVGGNQAAQK